MVLTIDIGNTNITFGAFEGDELTFVSRIATDETKTEDEYATKIRSVLTFHEVPIKSVTGAIISSVVPPLNLIMKRSIDMIFGTDSLIVGPGIKTGIKILCDDPSSVGADIICACVAAHNLYESPSLIIDMGTATKIIATDEEGSFIGVSIIPGVKLSLKALSSGAAQLPHISLEAPKSVIGKNTIDCMKSGIVFGSASMIDGMIDRMKEESGKEYGIIATGGISPSIVSHCRHSVELDKTLLLKGLNILYKKNS